MTDLGTFREKKFSRIGQKIRDENYSPKAYFPLDEKFARREIFIPMGMRNKIIMQ